MTSLDPTASPAVGSVPVPDPTKLTTDAVNAATSQWRRELSSVREIFETRLDAMDRAIALRASELDTLARLMREEIERTILAERRVTETRLAGMDEATKLLATNVDKVPYAILQEAGNLKALIMSKIDAVSDVSDEKFSAIDGTFASNALALTAALAAQKEAAAEQNKSNTLAITKSEQATKETIGANVAQTISGLSAQATAHQDLKERVIRLETNGLGRTEERTEQRAAAGSSIAVIMAVMVGISILISLGSMIIVLMK